MEKSSSRMGIIVCVRFIITMRMRLSLAKLYRGDPTGRPYGWIIFFVRRASMVFIICMAIILFEGWSYAKSSDDQNQIILLNDSAAALEDSDPELSKKLTNLADDKEKEWEVKSSDKQGASLPVSDQNKFQLQERIKLLKTAALAVQPTYPLIAKSLNNMADDIKKLIDNEK